MAGVMVARLVDAAVFALALALVGPTSVSLIWDGSSGPWRIALLMSVAVLHAIPLGYRAWPVTTFAVACAAMATFAAAPYLLVSGSTPIPAVLLPSAVGFFLALFAMGARERHSRLALAAPCVGAALVVGRLALDDAWRPAGGSPLIGWPGVAVIAASAIAAAWGLGRLRLAGEQRRESLELQAITAERNRIAGELHDVISHSLAVVATQAEGGRMTSTGPARDTFGVIATTSRNALADMRSLLGVVSGDDPRHPMPTLDQLPELAAQAGVQYRERGQPVPISPAASLSVYRVVQEALTNAMKHGRGAAQVELDWGADQLSVVVTNPVGTVAGSAAGRGIRGMTERVAAVGGTLSAGPEGLAWVVRAWVPLTREGDT